MVPRLSPKEREALKKEFLAKAGKDFERMFGCEEQSRLVTFDQREERAVDIGQGLGQWMLEQHIASDEKAGGRKPKEAACPLCGKACAPLPPVEDGPPTRAVKSRTGEVELGRREHLCAACRRRFFPSGH